jgi:thiamine-phosphate pyrophosphorylase
VPARRESLASAKLYLIVALGRLDAAVAALDGGVDIVQLRDKQAGDDELIEAARTLRPLCDRRGALLIVNDRPDVALACGADGVHVGQDDEALDAVRARVGPDLLIGISTHTPDQIEAAEASPADYLGVGPIFATPTKPGVEPVGLGLISAATKLTSKPFFAIGGIDAQRAPSVIDAGATRLAVVRAICDAEKPAAAARQLAHAFEEATAIAR